MNLLSVKNYPGIMEIQALYVKNCNSWLEKHEASISCPEKQCSLAAHFYSSKDYPRACAWYRKAATRGNVTAQYNLGICYYFGFGVTSDHYEALSWFKKARDNGDLDATRIVRAVLVYGFNVIDQSRAELRGITTSTQIDGLALEQDASSPKAHVDTIFLYGLHRLLLAISQRDNQKHVLNLHMKTAATYLYRASKGGHLDAVFVLGWWYQVVARDPDKALTWFKRRARSSNHALIEYFMGLIYFQNHKYQYYVGHMGVAANNLHYCPAKYHLGVELTSGLNIRTDVDEGVRLLTEAAKENHIQSQVYLATMYLLGERVPADRAMAKYWYTRSSQRGHAESQYRLAIIYGFGTKDGFYWLRKSAENGFILAQNDFGTVLACGSPQGAKSLADAREWFEKAAKNGDATAKSNLEALKFDICSVGRSLSCKQAEPELPPTPSQRRNSSFIWEKTYMPRFKASSGIAEIYCTESPPRLSTTSTERAQRARIISQGKPIEICNFEN